MNIEFFQNPPFVGGLLKQAPIKIKGFGFILLIKGLGFILFDSPSNINLNGISLLVFYYFPRISIQVVLKRNFLFKKQTFCHFLHKMFTYLKKNHEISYFAKLHPSGKWIPPLRLPSIIICTGPRQNCRGRVLASRDTFQSTSVHQPWKFREFKPKYQTKLKKNVFWTHRFQGEWTPQRTLNPKITWDNLRTNTWHTNVNKDF